MKPHVISIWHTGTRSTLAYYGLEQSRHGYTHIDGNWRLETLRSPWLIMPLRDPREVWRSWLKRSKRKSGEINKHPNDADNFEHVWALATVAAVKRNCMLLPVDHPRRDQYIKAINERWKIQPVLDEFPHVKDNDVATDYDECGINFDSIYNSLHYLGVEYVNAACV